MNFIRESGTPPPYTTTGLEAVLDGAAGTAATGTTTYNTQTRKVDGSFQVTFQATGALSGSFIGLQL
ncbi:hypothetical protein [Hymenobacter sp. B1770]|uniref:hypothetical protein n=1 Tax=Hymenobacter sp. B1770 TaxID=1718788 RepID=UPI003CF28A03